MSNLRRKTAFVTGGRRYLNRREFTSWLRANPRKHMASKHPDLCPVAIYLRETTEVPWRVSTLMCVPYTFGLGPIKDFRPPKWARQFIEELDKEYKGEGIIGAEALYILEEAVV